MSENTSKDRPDFLVIGAQKAATTWLHQNLAAHPGIWTPPIKEIHYFTHDRKKYPGAAIRSPLSPDHHSRAFFRTCLRIMRNAVKWGDRKKFLWMCRYLVRLRMNDRWYFSLFSGQEGMVKGEITPDYLRMTSRDIARLKAILPGVKIILILRDPVDRFWSHFKMDLKFRGMSPAEVSETEIIKLFHKPCYEQRGDYLTAIRRWREHFPDQQFRIFFYDDIREDALEWINRIYDYLGVHRMIPPSVNKRIFSSGEEDPIPSGVARYVAGHYYSAVEILSCEFDQAKIWLERMRQILAGEFPAGESRYVVETRR